MIWAHRGIAAVLCGIGLMLSGCGGDDGAQAAVPPATASATPTPPPPSQPSSPALVFQERQCQSAGWRLIELSVEGRMRRLMWHAPDTATWTKGAIVIMHGGGGNYYNFCVANDPIIGPQVRFTEMARQQGFAVLTLESTDAVTDNAGRLCGKVWDDEVRSRQNLDLPFIRQVVETVLPSLRGASDNRSIFITGLSSGGYMTVRAATHLGGRITAFAPVSSGDPYGWNRVCDPAQNQRANVFGAGYDNETGKEIPEINSCLSDQYPNERNWEDQPGVAPVFRLFHDENDGVNDLSCGMKVDRQLRAHGYVGETPFLLRGSQRAAEFHYWQDGYNQALLNFFEAAGGGSSGGS